MENERQELGEYITIINSEPIKFNVLYQKFTPDSNDPLNRHPYYYTFHGIPNILKKLFTINATSILAYGYFKDNIAGLHMNSIKFGILQLINGKRESKLMFGTHEYEEMKKNELKDPDEIRFQLLNFIYSVNKVWPQQEIKAADIEISLNIDKNNIEDWLKTLHEQELLKKRPEHKKILIFGAPYSGIDMFRIDPAKRLLVEEELSNYRNKSNVESENFENHRLKAFLSYSSKNKTVAGKIKDDLIKLNIEVFLAHETIRVSKEWEDKILEELNNCDIFVALVTKPFMESVWTNQEVGNAISKRKIIIPIIHGGKLVGFLKRYQYVKYSLKTSKPHIKKIIESLLENQSISVRFTNSLIDKLKTIKNFRDSEVISDILVGIDSLNPDQVNNIIDNSLLNNSILQGNAIEILKTLFRENGQLISSSNKDKLREKLNFLI